MRGGRKSDVEMKWRSTDGNWPTRPGGCRRHKPNGLFKHVEPVRWRPGASLFTYPARFLSLWLSHETWSTGPMIISFQPTNIGRPRSTDNDDPHPSLPRSFRLSYPDTTQQEPWCWFRWSSFPSGFPALKMTPAGFVVLIGLYWPLYSPSTIKV